MAAWVLRFQALRLALGESLVSCTEPHPQLVRYDWPCGCAATTDDGVNCLVVGCVHHDALFDPLKPG